VTNGNAPLPLQPSSPNPTLDILVEGMGRTNYGHALVDRKGILETVSLQNAGSQSGPVTGWQTFLLPMDEDFVAGLRPGVSDPARPGIFFRAQVTLRTIGDTYVDVSNWTKGVVWVNGHNLGRYWTIGPQHRLYCPASWLRRGTNHIVIFDLHQTTAKPISLASALA
jgi:beta-galactosidase